MEPRTLGAAAAAVLALVALLWPYVPWFASLGPTECPLGYGSGGSGSAADLSHFLATEGSGGGGKRAPQPALVIYGNASVVWTGDAARPHARAFVVNRTSGRFAFVGTNTACHAFATDHGPRHELVDLQGAHVIPGLVDSHLHLISGGLSLSRPSLAAVASRQQLADAVAAATAALRPGQWLLSGSGWDESRWGGEPPAAAWIDAATGDTPAWLLRHDAHSGLANSAALRLAGITAGTPDPPGGTIARGADGQPTGLLTDAAMQLVADRIPPLTAEERRAALDAAAQHALSRGITFVHDMGRIAYMEGEEAAWADLEEVLAPAADQRRLPLRVYAFVALPTWRRLAERIRYLGRAHPSGMLFWGGVKEFADGSLGSRTALFHEPYADQPGARGTRTIELERLRRLVASADAAGLQVAVHAIGDAAVDNVAAIYAELAVNRSSAAVQPGEQQQCEQQQCEQQQQQPARQPAVRHRIEHAQHLSSPAAAARLAAAGVVATPNPMHLPADAGILQARLGAKRAGPGHSYALRTLAAAGVTAAFGSDWPVVPLEPLAGTLHAAVHRRAPGTGAGPAWAPEEALAVAEALAAHTAAGAAAAGLQDSLGRIAPGLLADFAVLSGPPVADSPEGTGAGTVRQTYVGGRCAWGCRDGGSSSSEAVGVL